MRTAQVNLIEGEKTQEIDARLVITGGDGGGSWDPLQPGWQWKGDPCTLLLSILIFLSTKKMETAERAEILFNELDDDAGGEISEEDFIRWKPPARGFFFPPC